MTENQPQAAPPNRPPEPRTPLNAVFRRLSDGQSAADAAAPAPASAAPALPEPPPPASAAATAMEAIRASFAAAVLARASAAKPAQPGRGPAAEAAAAAPAEPPPEPEPLAAAPPEPEAPPVAPRPEPQPQAAAAVAVVPMPPAAAPPPDLPAGNPRPMTEAAPPAPEQNAAAVERRPIPAIAAAPPPVRAAAGAVPAWLVAPVLTIAIPDSPFGRGNRARAEMPPAIATAPREADLEPSTFGFAEPEPPPPVPSSEPDEAVAEVVPTPALASPPPEPHREESSDTEPASSTAPAVEPAEPMLPEEAAEPASNAAAALPSEELSAPPEEAASAAGESLAEALRRGIDAQERDAAASPSLPRSPGAARTSAGQLRAERPLDAPQAAPGDVSGEAPADAAGPGLPATGAPPLMVEPEAEPGETAPAPWPDDRPAMRNRRLYRRIALDASLEVDGAATKLLDLSMGGFAVANAPPVEPHAVVPVTVKMSIDGVDISTRMRARMIYTAAPRSGGRFIDLTASQTAFLRYLVTWRGQAVGALGTTTLLDAITRRPDSGRPDEPRQPEPTSRRPPWWSRWFGRLLGSNRR